MEASIKIELPTWSAEKDKDTGKVLRTYTKPVLYDMEFLKNKNIKEWEEGGHNGSAKCAIFSGGTNDKPTVFDMSKDALIEKLTRLGIIRVEK